MVGYFDNMKLHVQAHAETTKARKTYSIYDRQLGLIPLNACLQLRHPTMALLMQKI